MTTADPRKRILLDQLPRILQGYGNAFASYPEDYEAGVVVVCDLDDRCLKRFREELLEVLQSCHPAPETKFCIAVEECEAWFLGDHDAVKAAYPNAKGVVLDSYVNDSICGTWELLADAIHPGGALRLRNQPYYVVGTAKCEWARNIPEYMNLELSDSESFRYFRDSLRRMVGIIQD